MSYFEHSSNIRRYSQPLDNTMLREFTPSVFATSPWGEMSERYKFVPTIEVVDILRDRGFFPVRAEQSKTRIEGKGDFTRHMLRFRHRDFFGGDGTSLMTVGAEIPELVLVNSHDGTSAYKFLAGIFRLVCSNGMIVQSADYGSISVKHSGGSDFHDQIIDATFQVMDEAPRTISKIEGWKQLQLTGPQREVFASAALELKDNKAIQPRQLLTPRRSEDRREDVWTTSNVIQEHLIRGGDRGIGTTGRRMTTRSVKSVSEDLRLNRALWTLTERMAELVGSGSVAVA